MTAYYKLHHLHGSGETKKIYAFIGNNDSVDMGHLFDGLDDEYISNNVV